MTPISVHDIQNDFRDLDQWIFINGLKGYDPYDFKGLKIFRYIKNSNPCFKKARSFISKLDRICSPSLLRRLFNIDKSINNKSLALLALAYLNAYTKLNDDSYLFKCQSCLSLLKKNVNIDYQYPCWGYPFDWHSRVFFPKGTPSVVVTGLVAEAFSEYYKVTRDREALSYVELIANFFNCHLNISFESNTELCLSYTPLDSFKVLNATLFAANTFAFLANELNNKAFKDKTLKIINFISRQQLENGAFPYWGDEPTSTIDHYHTGFVLRYLYKISQYLSDQLSLDCWNKGFEYYCNNLFDSNGIPKHTPTNGKLLDIHSCAEALICLKQMPFHSAVAEELINSTYKFTRKHMKSSDGYFYYRMYDKRTKSEIIKFPYFRWGQAWVLYALSFHL